MVGLRTQMRAFSTCRGPFSILSYFFFGLRTTIFLGWNQFLNVGQNFLAQGKDLSIPRQRYPSVDIGYIWKKGILFPLWLLTGKYRNLDLLTTILPQRKECLHEIEAIQRETNQRCTNIIWVPRSSNAWHFVSWTILNILINSFIYPHSNPINDCNYYHHF